MMCSTRSLIKQVRQSEESFGQIRFFAQSTRMSRLATLFLFVVLFCSIHERVSSWKLAKVTSWSKQGAMKILGSFAVATSLLSNVEPPQAAQAYDRLNAATAAGTRVNSDAESLLRYGLPISNDKEIRQIQSNLETCKVNLKTRRVEFAKQDVKNVRNLLEQNEKQILKSISPKNQAAGEKAFAKFKADLDPLAALLEKETATGSGSVQERSALDSAFAAQKTVALDLSALEELMVPEGFKRVIPEEFAGLPVLQGRAEVEMVMKKADGSQYNVDGNLYDSVKLNLVC
jgi:hypothetical protein